METGIVKADWQNQIALVKSMVARGATDEEFALMSHIAVKYQLDPLVKQIWVVKYGSQPASIFTGRDGFLSIAHRTGQFDGIETVVTKVDEPIHVTKTRYKDRQKITIETKRDWQYKAVCTVRRKDADHPFTVEVYEEEYTTCENLWTSKPRTMLGKVAESQCLRKAFDIAGLYSPEEMPEAPTEKEINPAQKVEPSNLKKMQRAEAETSPEEIPTEPEPAKAGSRPARWALVPDEFRDYCKAAGFTNKKIFEIMDANQDDPEALKAYVHENPLQQELEMPIQGEEGMPQ